MKRKNLIVGVLVIALMALSLSGFNQRKSLHPESKLDTLPQKSDRKIRNLDDAIDEVDRGFEDLKKVDAEKIRREVETAMKNIDAAKIQMDAEKGLREVNMSKVNAEIEKAMKELNSEKMKTQLETALAKVDMEKIKVEMDKHTIEIDKVREQLKNIQPQIESSMKEARESLEKAKEELKEYKSFINQLEKDGLLNTKMDYNIKIDAGALYINGKKQNEEVAKKYQSFLEKHTEISIEKSDDNFEIHNNKNK